MAIYCYAAACAVFLVVGLFDFLVWGKSLIPNLGPELSAYALAKSALTACLAVLCTLSIVADGRAAGRATPGPVKNKALAAAGQVLALGFLLLFLASPTAFNWLGSEDNVVEYLSAIFLFAGALFFIQAFLAARRSPRKTAEWRFALWAAPAGALVLFLVGMEEISWMQRIIGFGTPESFTGNSQGETNIHNFSTTPVHSLYRLGGWASLILLPFIISFGPKLPFETIVRDFIPPAWIAALTVPLAGFNYNAWPFLPTQFIAFTTVLIMLVFASNARQGSRPSESALFAAGAALVVVAQSAFLANGRNFVRLWDVTEYQEFYIALGLAAFAWSAKQRVQARLATAPGSL